MPRIRHRLAAAAAVGLLASAATGCDDKVSVGSICETRPGMSITHDRVIASLSVSCKERPTAHHVTMTLEHRPAGGRWTRVGVPKQSSRIPGRFTLEITYFCEPKTDYRIHTRVRAQIKGKVYTPSGYSGVRSSKGKC